MVKCCTKKREKGHGNVRWKSRVGSKTGGKKRRHTQSGNSSKTQRQKHPRDKLIEVLEKQLHLRFCPSLFVLFLVSTIAFLSHFAFNPISPFNFRNCKIRQSSMACTHSRLQRRWRQNTMEMNLEKMDEKKPKSQIFCGMDCVLHKCWCDAMESKLRRKKTVSHTQTRTKHETAKCWNHYLPKWMERDRAKREIARMCWSTIPQ